MRGGIASIDVIDVTLIIPLLARELFVNAAVSVMGSTAPRTGSSVRRDATMVETTMTGL